MWVKQNDCVPEVSAAQWTAVRLAAAASAAAVQAAVAKILRLQCGCGCVLCGCGVAAAVSVAVAVRLRLMLIFSIFCRKILKSILPVYWSRSYTKYKINLNCNVKIREIFYWINKYGFITCQWNINEYEYGHFRKVNINTNIFMNIFMNIYA